MHGLRLSSRRQQSLRRGILTWRALWTTSSCGSRRSTPSATAWCSTLPHSGGLLQSPASVAAKSTGVNADSPNGHMLQRLHEMWVPWSSQPGHTSQPRVCVFSLLLLLIRRHLFFLRHCHHHTLILVAHLVPSIQLLHHRIHPEPSLLPTPSLHRPQIVFLSYHSLALKVTTCTIGARFVKTTLRCIVCHHRCGFGLPSNT